MLIEARGLFDVAGDAGSGIIDIAQIGAGAIIPVLAALPDKPNTSLKIGFACDASYQPPFRSLLTGCLAQSLIQIGDQILGILDPDGQAHEFRRSSCGTLLFFGQLPVGG